MSKRRKRRVLAKKEKNVRKDKFHIIAKARGGTYAEDNISYVRIDKHRAYHFLFGLKSPDEIIVHLINYYWKGQTKWLKMALEEVKNGMVEAKQKEK